MKKAFTITILIGITFLGCSDNSDNPLELNSYINEKITTSIKSNLSDLIDTTLVENPNGDRTQDDSDYKKMQVSKFINGAIGGEFIFDTTFVNREGRIIDLHAQLKFSPDAFEGQRKITMYPCPEDLSIRFFPNMTFNNNVKLDYIITGLDLEEMGFTAVDNVQFVYFSPNGDIELIKNESSNVHPQQQLISLRNGNLSHFSRYGWVR